MPRVKDYSPNGMKLEGIWENDRNAEDRDVLSAVIREAFDVDQVIVAHHLVYVKTEKRDGYDYQIVEEIPSADTLIFDHEVAKKIWGPTLWKDTLARLALEPAETRDALFTNLYKSRAIAPAKTA